MFDLKYLVLAIVLVALLPISSCRPMELDRLVNKTMCAFKVKFDKDKNRIPYIIKTIKCEAHPKQICVANKIENNNCCDETNGMECVEMMDTVLVYNKTAKAMQSIDVSVGCACMIQSANEAVNAKDAINSGR